MYEDETRAIIDEIAEIRKKTRSMWVLLGYPPPVSDPVPGILRKVILTENGRKLLGQIAKNDRKISELTMKLVE